MSYEAIIRSLFSTVEWTPTEPPDDLQPGELYATHLGTLRIGNGELNCVVLNNGARVFEEESMHKFIEAVAIL